MTQYNILNLKWSTLQLNWLKSGMKSGTKVTLKISSKVVGDSNHETNFSQKFSLTNTQVSKLRKVFANGSSTSIKLLKTQLDRIEQSGKFLGRSFEPLIKAGLPLIRNVLKPLAS